jgi:hypothetical protein
MRGLALVLPISIAITLCLFSASPDVATAVLISTGDGTGNTTPPVADPGFDNVGVVNGLSGVYVGNGWVLTANHVGEHPILLLGESYEPVTGSRVQFQNPDTSMADLIAYKLRAKPPLPAIAITNGPPSTNTLVTIIGNGFNRGSATSWTGIDGWNWGAGRTIRWGTNRIFSSNCLALDTQCFRFDFDENPSGPPDQHEADVVNGDSGGGAFTGSGASTELIGILFARGGFMNQPANTSLFGNAGYAADLFAYRNDILAVIDQPDCDDGLDEDADGLADFPADPGCSSPFDTDEREPTLVCDNGIDDDNDGLIDFPNDFGCWSGIDPSERGAVYECDNGIDDDGDLLIDYPDDDGCLHPTNPVEAPEPVTTSMLGAGVLALSVLARRARRRSGPLA